MKLLPRIGLFVIVAAELAWVVPFAGSTWDLVFLLTAAVGAFVAATLWTPLGLLVHGLAWVWFPIDLAVLGLDFWTEVAVATVVTAGLLATALLLMGRKLAVAGWVLAAVGLVQGVWIVTGLTSGDGGFVPGNVLFTVGCLLAGLAWAREGDWTERSYAGSPQ